MNIILYNAAGIPVGPRAIVQVQRPTYSNDTSPNYAAGVIKPKVADIIIFGAVGNTVGAPVEIAGLSISLNAEPNTTTGPMGESKNDPTVLRGSPTLNIESFITSDGMPSLLPGDFIDLFIGNAIDSTAAAPVRIPKSRWVFTSASISTNGANKSSIALVLDRPNSDPTLTQF